MPLKTPIPRPKPDSEEKEKPEKKSPKYASISSRATALTIDQILISLPIFLIVGYFYYSGISDKISMDIYAVSNDVALFSSISPKIHRAWLILNSVAWMYFWISRSATPGKINREIIIVDSKTLKKPTHIQFAIRYAILMISLGLLGIPMLWAYFDKNKQALHDKFAKTVVIEKDA